MNPNADYGKMCIRDSGITSAYAGMADVAVITAIKMGIMVLNFVLILKTSFLCFHYNYTIQIKKLQHKRKNLLKGLDIIQ